MANSINEEVRKWMLANNLKSKDVVEATGISKEAFSNYLTGVRKWSTNAAKRMSEVYGLNFKYLKWGEGELTFSPQTASGNSAPVIQQQGNGCNGNIYAETSKDKIIEQLTESNRELVENNTKLLDMMADVVMKLSDHITRPRD